MKTLFKNVNLVNVFVDEIERTNVLICDDKIVGVCSDYSEDDADNTVDCTDKYMCPGFIDGHIHIESTKLTPPEFCRIVVPHGTLGVVADPHEIANVCGVDGIEYMLAASQGLPMDVNFMVPSCVPATAFDEAGAVLEAKDIKSFYGRQRIIGLAEMMNYPGVIYGDKQVKEKIDDANKCGVPISGHAPLLSGKDLNSYVASGIYDDHECSNLTEAIEKIKLGQNIMIRYASSEKNLGDLMELFEPKYNHRCCIVTDDKDQADIKAGGHIDEAVKKAIEYGADPFVAIRMATLQPAKHYQLDSVGAVAPGYYANFLLLDDLNSVKVNEVYYKGALVARSSECLDFNTPNVPTNLEDVVKNSVNMKKVIADDFCINQTGIHKCAVIGYLKDQVITDRIELDIDFDKNNGVDINKDIVKVALIERHKATGHIGLGFVKDIGLKCGAIASTIGHDSHNLVVVGVSDSDMSLAANTVADMHGGCVAVKDDEVLAKLCLPVAGIMTDAPVNELEVSTKDLRDAVLLLTGQNKQADPLLASAFLPLPVIPKLKITTKGLFDVDKFELCNLVLD